MTRFEALFGIKTSSVKKNCILMPVVAKGILHEFKVDRFSPGRLYTCTGNDDFTVIRTGIGQTFTADAVLYLKDTPCRRVFLFGSCGLVKERQGLSIGNLVSPARCWGFESFYSMLSEHGLSDKVFYPDRSLFGNVIKAGKPFGIQEVDCATVASLKLEEERQQMFARRGIDVVDMECSAFFAAAAYADLKAATLFYITDIIKIRPFYAALPCRIKAKVDVSLRTVARFLCTYISENVND
jgi:purine-nucleoside phosphorylase